MLVFALCLMARPVLAAWGEMHELTAHAGSALTHADHDAPHAAGTDAGDPDSGNPAHLLLHHAHCCGHSTGLIDAGLLPLAVPFISIHPPLAALPAAVAARAATPFRPPISR